MKHRTNFAAPHNKSVVPPTNMNIPAKLKTCDEFHMLSLNLLKALWLCETWYTTYVGHSACRRLACGDLDPGAETQYHSRLLTNLLSTSIGCVH